MGLMYQFPVKEGESEHILVNGGEIKLSTYGLPYLFWGYLAASLGVLLIMYLAVKSPLQKMLIMDDPINQKLAYLMILTFILIPVVSIAFFFYQKDLIKEGNKLTVVHRLFGLSALKKTYQLSSELPFKVYHSLETPNVAKIKNDPEMRAFQNQGYFELKGKTNNGVEFLIDRNNRRADLNKIAKILERY